MLTFWRLTYFVVHSSFTKLILSPITQIDHLKGFIPERFFPIGRKTASTLSAMSPFLLWLSFKTLLCCIICCHRSKLYTCARFCRKAVTYCDQRWKSDSKPNYIALTSVPPPARVPTHVESGLLIMLTLLLYTQLRMIPCPQVCTNSQFYKRKSKRVVLNLITRALFYITLPNRIKTHKNIMLCLVLKFASILLVLTNPLLS